MRLVIFLLVLSCGLSFADGGGMTCASDYTYDTLKTTVWRAKVKAVQRNGVLVTSGAYNGTYSISLLDSMRFANSRTNSDCSSSIGNPWKCLTLSGKGIWMDFNR